MGFTAELHRVAADYFESPSKDIKSSLDVDKCWGDIMCVLGGGFAGAEPTARIFMGDEEYDEETRYNDQEWDKRGSTHNGLWGNENT